MPVLSAIFVFAVFTVIAVENKAQLKCQLFWREIQKVRGNVEKNKG